MTVQVDSQPMTDQLILYIDVGRIDNSSSCLEKKTTLGTHDQTCYTVSLSLRIRISIITYWCTHELCWQEFGMLEQAGVEWFSVPTFYVCVIELS